MRDGAGTEGDAPVTDVAARHGLSPGAVEVLWRAMLRGGGRMAQFSHPDLGGMGQWSGGMLQIGAMFDGALKARVAGACADLAAAAARAPRGQRRDGEVDGAPSAGGGAGAGAGWWPGAFGEPSASGSQDGMRYAYFAEARRLAVERDGRTTLYDTGRHRIFGASQSQGGERRLAFTADDGTVEVASLRVVPD